MLPVCVAALSLTVAEPAHGAPAGSVAGSAQHQPVRNVLTAKCWSQMDTNFLCHGERCDIMEVKAATAADCCGFCSDHAAAGCSSWTFERPCAPHSSKCANCVLKRNATHFQHFAGTISGGIGSTRPQPGPKHGYFPQPQVHVTPPCYNRKGGWHDIAGALQHPLTGRWHLFVGPSWQHVYSDNLVDWTVSTTAYPGMGGSGTLIFDDHRNLTVALTGTVSAFTSASTDLLTRFTPAGQIFKTVDPVAAAHGDHLGCWDPVAWWDERVSRYFAMGACGHNNGGGGMTGSGGYGLQQMFTSPELSGPGANWSQLQTPFLEWHAESVHHVGTWPRTHEFVTPDFFPLGDNDSWIFLTTNYGGLLQTRLNTTVEDGLREYDYSSYLAGPRPAPGESFKPDESRSGPWDWSPFTPVSDPHSKSLTFATSKGMEQFGCCPKTAGNHARRVLFGWINVGRHCVLFVYHQSCRVRIRTDTLSACLQNGWDQGPGEPDRPDGEYNNNTLSLPRDVSIAPTGQVLQRFVPELARLRANHTQVGAHQLSTGGPAAAQFIANASGLQLEIKATFSRPLGSTARGVFGITVLSSADHSEYTAISFDPMREQVLVDRSHSGLGMDEDVRGGPWPAPASERVSVHIYVDVAVVEVIANATHQNASGKYLSDETTALAVWVAPTSALSNRVGLFSEIPGVTLEKCDIWQLMSPSTVA